MTFVQKPDKFPEWASEDHLDPSLPIPNVVEPDAAKKKAGWFYKEPPPANWFNWLLRYIYRWISFFEQQKTYQKPFVNGLAGSNDITNPTTVIDNDVGSCTDSTNSIVIVNNTANFKKDITQVWAAGSGNGGRASSVTLVNGMWLHRFAIMKPDGTVDFGVDDDVDCVGLLVDAVGYTYYKRIGSWKLEDASTDLMQIHQQGNEFYYKKRIGATRVDWVFQTKTVIQLNTPPDVITKAYIGYGIDTERYIGGCGYTVEPMFVDDYVLNNSNAKGSYGNAFANPTIPFDCATTDFVVTDANRQVWWKVESLQVAPNAKFFYNTFGWIEYF